MSDIVNYVEGLDLFGIKAKQIPCLTGSGAPSAESALKIGLLYINEDNGDMYKCVNSADGLVWNILNVNSSSTPMFFISNTSADGISYYLVYYNNHSKYATMEEVFDAYMSGNAYFIDNNTNIPNKINKFFISASDSYAGNIWARYGDSNNDSVIIHGSTAANLNEVVEKYLLKNGE